MITRSIRVTGIVQGVGFRPYVWRLARELALNGWVRNDAAGVEIRVAGNADQLDQFTRRLPAEIPPLAQIRAVNWTDTPGSDAWTDFSIIASAAGPTTTQIGPDTAVCPECLAELFNPADRRWRYPFINCTHCGPRYTLTLRLPYDRAQTSMAAFPLCPACEQEYRNPADRRFHAEPTACPVCGPKLWLESLPPPQAGEGWGEGAFPMPGHDMSLSPGPAPACGGGEVDPLAATLTRLQAGQIIALKGLGGFHLACDARNAEAVARLRTRKHRDEKPFALMAANLASIAPWVEFCPAEADLLQSPEHPIVLLRKKPGADEAFPGIAPGLAWLGVLLPYTPIHWLIFHEAAGRPAGTGWMAAPQERVLVMTSANPGGEPLVIGNDEARTRLAGIADALLRHDRDIVVPCDDSVVRAVPEKQASAPPAFGFIRRARGYTPRPIRLPRPGPAVLALGGYLKNTVCVTRGDEAFVSQHIGSLDNPATCTLLMEVTAHLLHILEVQPQAVAHDLHPDFFSTRHALELADRWQVPARAVQHHHAHLAAVAAEHGINGPILGLALDGVGLGTSDDTSGGNAWGGELLRLDGPAFTRLGHLAPLPLPGGDKAAREPWRMAAAALHRLGRSDEIPRRFAHHPAASQLPQLLARGLHSPPTTSLGRWFDAAAGLLGVREVMAYEGQAAMLLEGLAEQYGEVPAWSEGYALVTAGGQNALSQLDLLPLLACLADEPDPARGAALFHATLAKALADWTIHAARQHRLDTVALGGGCLLNAILSRQLTDHLSQAGLKVLHARQAPPNDGGLSLGQAWIAMQSIAQG